MRSPPPAQSNRRPGVLAWICGLLAACATAAGATERNYYFEQPSAEEGLRQNTVWALAQDSTGYLWVGTEGGLHRYDGYRFDFFQHDAQDSHSLPAGIVRALAADDAGRVWVGLFGSGLVRFDPIGQAFWQPFPAAPAARSAVDVHALAFDPGHGLWSATGSDIELIDPELGLLRARYPLPGGGSRDESVNQLLADGDGSLWVATSTGLLRLPAGAQALGRVSAGRIGNARALLRAKDGALYVGTSNGLFRIEADGSARHLWSSVQSAPVSALAEDGTGRLWLATDGEGLAIYTPGSGEVELLMPDRAMPGSLPDAEVRSLLVDRSGLLWVGTRVRGVVKVDPAGARFRYVVDQNPARNTVKTNNLESVLEDATGALWLGTTGDGLKRYDPASGDFQYHTAPLLRALGIRDARADLRVHALASADGRRLWVATDHGACLYDPARESAQCLPSDGEGHKGLPDTDVLSVITARDGSVWLGTRYGGLSRFDPASGEWRAFRHIANSSDNLSNDSVYVLREDREGRIWAGTLDGLNLIDARSGGVRVFRNEPGDAGSLSGNLVRAILEGRDGTLWIGTHSGLNHLESLTSTQARFKRWSTRDALADTTVYAILEDATGRLWMSSNSGIRWLDRNSGEIHTAAPWEGLQGLEFNGDAATPLHDGQLAFGGINGLNLVQPERVVTSHYRVPIAITSVQIGNRSPQAVDPVAGLSFAHADRIVHFEFAALDFATPSRNRFSYRLEGFDRGWTDAGTRHNATYTNLDAGRYVLRVRAGNRDGYWNEDGIRLPVQVIPPWWESWPARAIYALALLALGYFLWQLRHQRRRAELAHNQALREREDRLNMALWGSGDEFWDLNLERQELVRIGAAQMFGDASEETLSIERWKTEQIHPDDRGQTEQRLNDHLAGRTEVFESEHRMRGAKGKWIWVLSRGKLVERDAQGRPLRVCGTARDVTATRLAERERRIAQEVIRSMTEAVAVTDLDYRFMSVNPAFTRMTGWHEEEVRGRAASLLNCAQHSPEYYLSMRETLNQEGHWRGELWQRRKDNEEFLCWLEVSEVRDASGTRTHFVSVLTDITDRKRSEQELRYLANYDTLTGLPNRTLLSERLGHAIIRARRGARRVAVLFLDLDRFKHVNDSMGHAAGDRMLKAAGNRLRQVVRDGDTVARLGGDEFTVVLEDVSDVHEAEQVAQKLLIAFQAPLELESGQDVVISPSIGISIYPEHGQTPTDLLKFADTAMYQAKDRGRRTYMVYTEAMDETARVRATMVGALRKALDRHEFSLVYQPKLSLNDGQVVGVEALLRWTCEEFGSVSPAVFVPLAEEIGMIVEIGDWVLNEACAQIARWREDGIENVAVAVNVSVLQLQRGQLAERLGEILAENGLAPTLLELELTESMVMANAEQSITTLRQLKRVGVTLAIDDFGTGYSSLSYLKRLPIDTLKIDKEFVGDITTDPDDEAITATIITMAHSLDLNVVAEGVESPEQVEYLREQGCDEVQGHWLSPPLPPDRCLQFLRRHAPQRGTAAAVEPR